MRLLLSHEGVGRELEGKMEWESFLIEIKEGEEMEEQPVVSLI